MLLQDLEPFSVFRVDSGIISGEFIRLDSHGALNVVNVASKRAATISPDTEVMLIGKVGMAFDKNRLEELMVSASNKLKYITEDDIVDDRVCEEILDDLREIAQLTQVDFPSLSIEE